MADVKIEIGYALPKEKWEKAADNLEQVGKIMAMWLLKKNFDGRGQEDAEDFLADITLASVAMRYVANYATEKCRMIPVQNHRSGKEKENGGIH